MVSLTFFSLRCVLISIIESMDMGRSDLMADRRLRLASSSPDVKALFNAPAYIYGHETQEDVETNYIPAGPPVPGLDYWTPLPPIVSSQLYL